MRVEEAREVTPGLAAAVRALLPQLSGSAPPPSEDDLRAIVDSPTTALLVAFEGDEIVGMLTLALFRLPTGLRAWIEDVVVDATARRRGVGRALTEAALEVARRRGARTVDLTTRPAREAANAMYESLGFVRRETNVYRFEF